MSETVYIGMGSNLGERQQQLSWAIKKLANTDQIKLTQCSSVYESAPIGDFPDDDIGKQPDFLNAVCQIETNLPARTLLDQLLDIEKQSGRVRTDQRNDSRTLDLDLLLFGDYVINTADLCVPHPRLHNRAFVLYPLLEIAPQLEVPGKGRVDSLIKNVGSQEIKKLPERIYVR